MQARRHLEAGGGQLDGGLEQARPRQLALLLVQKFQRPQGAGHADAQATEDGVFQVARLAIDQKPVGLGGLRCRLAAVVALELLALCIPVQNEGAAADPGRLRLYQIEHELHGNRGIGRTAAGAQDFETRLHRIGIGRGHHLRLGGGERPAHPAGSGFG